MDSVGVGVVDVAFRHLAGHYVLIINGVVAWQIRIDAQIKTVVFLDTSVAYEDEGTEVLYYVPVDGILVDKSRMSASAVPCFRDACLVELYTVGIFRSFQMIGARI